ncbi:MAG TPA: TIGR03668 family PPOX class F420-dependent oxidoreductase [Baekduia sp.]|nr:TIGR03668 family PPOX class F420-dependent oxidoreductase [Baekduia sp.]
MDPWALLATARVARFATLTPDGRPTLVPVCFAIEGQTIFHAVDDKPKATRRLARLTNLAADPRASLLADHYDEDWSALWWVRADGTAHVLDDAPELIDALVEKYAQYGERRPAGPVIALEVDRIRAWTAS